MKNYITFLRNCVRQVFDKPLNTFKFTVNNIEEIIFVFEPSYEGFSSLSIRYTSSISSKLWSIGENVSWMKYIYPVELLIYHYNFIWLSSYPSISFSSTCSSIFLVQFGTSIENWRLRFFVFVILKITYF